MSRLRERILRMMRCDYWVTAYRKRDGSAHGGDSLIHDCCTDGFRLLPQRRFITQADPFLFEHNGDTWLFYERQDLTDMKGTLWCRNLDDASAGPVPVLEEPFHLSYPQVFRYGKEIYLLPETRKAGEVRLYRCLHYPDRWEKAETLFDFPAVDTTIFPTSDHVSYFFTYVEGRLEIFLCEMEKEQFRIMKRKKIYVSGKSATVRPGGAVMEENGVLYRSAQNCTDYYGQELLINQIDRLDGSGFAEHVYTRLSPQQIHIDGVQAVGIHTYNCSERYEVIDILHRECSLWTIGKKLWWKIRGSEG